MKDIVFLIIGSGLTLIIQFLLSLMQSSKETDQKRKELIAQSYAKKYLIFQLLKDLVMYKVHKEYYFRAYKLNGDVEDHKKHYEKGQEQRDLEYKIDIEIAQYLEVITALNIILKEPSKTNEYIKILDNYEHPKASNFVNILDVETLQEALIIEEKRINSGYDELRKILSNFQPVNTN